MTTLTPLATAQRLARSLPVTQQLRLIMSLVDGAEYADFADRDLRALDLALGGMLDMSVEADAAADTRMYGRAA